MGFCVNAFKSQLLFFVSVEEQSGVQEKKQREQAQNSLWREPTLRSAHPYKKKVHNTKKKTDSCHLYSHVLGRIRR